MNSITKEFKAAAEERYGVLKAEYKANTHFACSVDLYQIRTNAKNETIKEWAKEGRDMSDVDFDVELDVDLNL